MTAETTIEILIPVAEDVPEELGLSPALPTLDGKVIGLLENRKYHADTFMAELEQALLNDYGVKKGDLRPQSHLQRPASRRQAGGAAGRMRRHHPRHRRLRLLHGVGSPRHGSHRSRRRAVGKRHHQQLWPRRPRPRRRPRDARRPHRHPPQPPGLPPPRRRPPNGPRPRPRNRRAADRAVTAPGNDVDR